MNESEKHPETLWSPKELPVSVDAYFSAHRGEFSLRHVKSKYPYGSDAWKKLRALPEINPYEGYHRFEGRGEGCWEPVRDKIRNPLTADLLATAELVSGKTRRTGTHGAPGGIGIDQSEVWVGFLDGGVGVEVHIGEDEETNRPEGWQRTTIRGPLAFRCLVEFLGFDWISEPLANEDAVPSQEDVRRLINKNLSNQIS